MKKRLFVLILTLALALSCLPLQAMAVNPYLPLWERVPDGEPHIFADPVTGEDRVYVYGSHDASATARYCGPDHVVWSAPCDDLTNWRHEGIAFHVDQLDGLKYTGEDGTEQTLEIQPGHVLYAPDVTYNPVTKKYYMYVHIAEAEPAAMLFVASSDKPAGPFTDPHVVLTTGFDPSVYVDMENLDAEGYPAVYLFTGGGGVQSACQLSGKDMYTVIEGTTRTGGSDGLLWAEADESPNKPTENYRYFFEASSVRKIGKFYVLVYSGKIGQRDVGTMDYAYSTDPFGPYTYGGSIVDNRGETVTNPYTGTQSTAWMTGNNHGGLVEINGQWYIFYHRRLDLRKTERQGMIEPITIKVTEDRVIIDQVEMTSQGVETDGLDPYALTDAGILVHHVGKTYAMRRVDTHTGSMDDWDPKSTDPAMDWNPVIGLTHQTMIGYKYFNFADGIPAGAKLRLDLSLKSFSAGTTVNVYTSDAKTNFTDPEQPRTLIGSTVIEAVNEQEHTVSCSIEHPEVLQGKKAIFLEFLNEADAESTGLLELNKLQFVKELPPFEDVQDASKFFFEPVYWAFNADPQITNGTDATHFSPEASCTRGQVVTFLWRAAGCPEPKNAKTAFTDLKPGAFYEKAVAWAVEQGITKGTSGTTFSPDATCTRGQIVTFLYRFKESPVVEKAKSPFTDLKPGAFYEDAVAWAVANKVTNGMTATTFVPDATCTRGQVVTFLYRAVK